MLIITDGPSISFGKTVNTWPDSVNVCGAGPTLTVWLPMTALLGEATTVTPFTISVIGVVAAGSPA